MASTWHQSSVIVHCRVGHSHQGCIHMFQDLNCVLVLCTVALVLIQLPVLLNKITRVHCTPVLCTILYRPIDILLLQTPDVNRYCEHYSTLCSSTTVVIGTLVPVHFVVCAGRALLNHWRMPFANVNCLHWPQLYITSNLQNLRGLNRNEFILLVEGSCDLRLLVFPCLQLVTDSFGVHPVAYSETRQRGFSHHGNGQRFDSRRRWNESGDAKGKVVENRTGIFIGLSLCVLSAYAC